ncbi:MAG: hypothetical protein ABIT38_14320, partial [Gemmatimonadaceae bacterium]
FHAERDAEGDEALRRALQLEPRNVIALMESARASTRRGDLARAISFWQRVVVFAPESRSAGQARQGIAHAAQLSAVLEVVDA